MDLHLGKEVKRWILGVAVAVIIVSFIFFYGYSQREGSGDAFVVGRINGRPVVLADYKRQYEALQDAYRERLDDSEEGRRLARQLRQEALYVLLQRAFLLDVARRYGVGPSDYEVLVQVANMREFRTESGHFNEELFKRVPQHIKRRLERDRRDELTLSHLQMRIMDTVKVTDAEVREAFETLNTKAAVAYAFEPSPAQGGEDLFVPVSGGKAERVRDRVRRGQDFFAACRAEGLVPERTRPFGFGGRIPLAGRTNAFASELEGVVDVYRVVFASRRGAVDVVPVRGGKAVVLVTDLSGPDWRAFAKEAESLRRMVRRTKMNETFSVWYTDQVRTAKVQDNLSRLFRED